MRKRIALAGASSSLGLMASLMAGSAEPAAAAPWMRGFVVGSYEYAYRYGGRAGFTRESEIEPGVDCPHGSTVHFANPAQTQKAVARQKWRLPNEAEYIATPPGLD